MSAQPSSLSAFANLVPNRGGALPPPASSAVASPPASHLRTDLGAPRPIAGVDGVTNATSARTVADGIGPSHATQTAAPSAASDFGIRHSDLPPAPSTSVGVFPTRASPSSAGGYSARPMLGGYGAGDLTPAGTAPFGGGGGMAAGPSNPMVREAFGYGGYPSSHGGGAYRGGPPPGARYLPVGPGEGPRRGGVGGRGGFNTFGEPDPDHMPPFDPTGLNQQQTGAPTFGRGRGGMPSSRGLGGPGDYFY